MYYAELIFLKLGGKKYFTVIELFAMYKQALIPVLMRGNQEHQEFRYFLATQEV